MSTAQNVLRKFELTPFMGIALADILANGVSIIMLLIAITISSKYQLEQEKLEQVDEVTQVLSRDIASSVVMNNLAASPPAVLHDYVNSPSDRDLRHAVMPILELRQDSIRDYYSGHSWSREQLLRQDNPFDFYLDSLDQNQRLRIRTDIYQIGMFYIYMSILKDHDIIPRHWHFSVAKSGDGVHTMPLEQSNNWAKFLTEEGDEGPGEGLWGREQQAATMSMAGSEFSEGSYPWDELGNDSEQATGPGTTRGVEFELRFRLASSEIEEQSGEFDLQGSELDQYSLLIAALSYLKFINNELQQGNTVIRALQDMVQHLQRFVQAPLALSPAEQQTIRRLIEVQQQRQHDAISDDSNNGLFIEHQQQSDFQGLAMALQLNQPVTTVNIIGDPKQADYLATLPERARVHFHLQHFPELFQGLSMEFLPESILLAPDYAPDDRWRWYPVFFVYPEFDDFVMGFIYATVSSSGAMRVAAESNHLAVAGYSLQQQRGEAPAESEYLLATVFGVVLLVLLLIYGLSLWRRMISPYTDQHA